MRDDEVTLFLCGDVMLGRGIDQILPHPGDPTLREPSVTDARSYVTMAERANGPVPRPVDVAWPWGEALEVLDSAAIDARIINVENAVTRSDDFAPGKAVHYRMTPENLPALRVARPDVCVLANNHLLDFGHRGLEDTLRALEGAGLPAAGAGRDRAEAWRPATVPLAAGGRVVVLAVGMRSSGVPADWAAGRARPGVALLPEADTDHADQVVRVVAEHKRPGDLVVVSIHWGSNWGYEVARKQTRFAHALVDGGVDVVHGHSSHHPRPIEVYRGRLVLYGCGDFVNDYEGISGHEAYRDDLRIAYLVSLRLGNGELTAVRLVPFQARRMRLANTTPQDIHWLGGVLDRVSRPFGTGVEQSPEGRLSLRWA